ncbi:MAG TPA: hypothetical protein VN654_30490 [Vicinamibacterales bacterium]|jgi:hypothetical protein|nr:hypothetical protein [Vicinamibacterales bacterium]
MTREDRDEFLKILHAHARTVEICDACAETTRDLALEVQRGGMPKQEDLRRTVEEAEQVLADLVAVRDELRRLLIEFS